MRFDVHSGTPTSPISFCVTHVKPARGTQVAMVGTRASCQPMPVLIMETPAASISLARESTSSQSEPWSTRSSMDSRKMTAKSSPTDRRTAFTISTGSRMRLP